MIIDFIKADVARSTKRRRLGSGYKSLDKSLFLEVFYRLITYNNLLFNFCRSPAFWTFFKIINLEANDLLY